MYLELFVMLAFRSMCIHFYSLNFSLFLYPIMHTFSFVKYFDPLFDVHLFIMLCHKIIHIHTRTYIYELY